MAGTIHIEYLNHEQTGFNDSETVAAGTTILQFVQAKMPSRDVKDLIIRINNVQPSRHYVLQEGDRVAITPSKLQGAGR